MPPIGRLTNSVADEYLKSLGEYYDEVAEFESKRVDQTWLQSPDEKLQFTEQNTEAFIQEPYEPTEADLGYAIFAKDSYKPVNQRSNFNNYEYLINDSTDSIATYKNELNKELVFALKGSSPETAVGDFFRNTGIALGTVGSVFTYPKHLENTQFINKVKSKHPNKKVIVTGHSAGGSYANYLGVDNPDYQVYSYNMGTGLPLIKNWLSCKLGNCDNIKNYRIVGDWASSFSGMAQGNTFLLRPRIPTKEIQEEAEKVERFYLPAEVSIAHGINQFIDRKDNLKEDYGRYGRKMAGGLGALAGIAGTALLKSQFVAGQVGREAGAEAVRQIRARPVATYADPTTPIRQTRLFREPSNIEKYIKSPVSTIYQGIHTIAGPIRSLNDFSQNMIGVGLGKLAGEVSYDLFFKPAEEDIEKF